MRKNLIEKRILKQDGHVLIFTEDYLFNSPSAAAATILARSTNAGGNGRMKMEKQWMKKLKKSSS